MQGQEDAGQDGCRDRKMQDRTDIGQDGCRTDQMQDIMDAGPHPLQNSNADLKHGVLKERK